MVEQVFAGAVVQRNESFYGIVEAKDGLRCAALLLPSPLLRKFPGA